MTEPIRDIPEIWTQQLQDECVPASHRAADEHFLAFKGQCSFWVYLPSRQGKYDIAVLINMYVYTYFHTYFIEIQFITEFTHLKSTS